MPRKSCHVRASSTRSLIDLVVVVGQQQAAAAAREQSSECRSLSLSLGSSEFHQSVLASRCSSLRAGSVVRFSLDIVSLRDTSISPRGIEWGTSSLCLDSL